MPLPPEPQVGALCEVLNAYGVRYVVFGSVAGRLYGAELRTVDLDIVPDISDDNLQRLADALNSLNPRWRVSEEGPGMKLDGRLEPRHFRGDSLAVGLVTEIGYCTREASKRVIRCFSHGRSPSTLAGCRS